MRLNLGRRSFMHLLLRVLRTPRRIWSRSMLSNSALKLPSPKPSSFLRWMNSKNTGPICRFGKDLQQQARIAVALSSRRAGCRASAVRRPARHGRAGARRASRNRSRAAAVMKGVPSALSRSQQAMRSSQMKAICWMPSPLKARRNSSIWPLRPAFAFFIERDADLAVRCGHRLAGEAGIFALDVEIADLAEAEDALVEARPNGPCARHRHCGSGDRSS